MSFDAKCNPSEAAYRAPVPAAGEEASLIASDASARNSTEKQSMPAGGPSKEDDADMMSDQYRLQQAAQMYQLMPAGAALADLGDKPACAASHGGVEMSASDKAGEHEKGWGGKSACSRLRAAILIVIVIIAMTVGGLLIWRLALSNSLADVAPDPAGAGFQGTCNHIYPVRLPLLALRIHYDLLSVLTGFFMYLVYHAGSPCVSDIECDDCDCNTANTCSTSTGCSFAVNLPLQLTGSIAPLQAGVTPLHLVSLQNRLVVNSPSTGLTRFTYRTTVAAETTQSITHIYFSLCPPILDRTMPSNLDNSWSALSSSTNTLDDTQWTGYRRAVTIPAGGFLDSVFNVTNPFVLAPISIILRFPNNNFFVATVLGPVISTCTGKRCFLFRICFSLLAIWTNYYTMA